MSPEELARLQAAMAGQPGALDAMRAANQGALQQGPYRMVPGAAPAALAQPMPYRMPTNGVPIEQFAQQMPNRMTLQEREALLNAWRNTRPPAVPTMTETQALAKALRGER